MDWVELIVGATGWRHTAEEPGWEQVEAELGLGLPADFKELDRRFGAGVFSGGVSLLRPVAGDSGSAMLSMWAAQRQVAGGSEIGARMFEPYGIYGPAAGADGSGLLQWGYDLGEGEYYWLVERAVPAERWSVIARRDGGGAWYRFDMRASEFVYRVLADPEFEPFTIADPPRVAFFLPPGEMITSAEEWAAMTDPSRRS
ncbi:hypothetical protein [Actinoplanes sp. OR16]|uniref:hypothetical protein n=1 Tax=Actinoplanes sp. OR16 TaxID=946334 RepID=UPI000FDAD5E3|nr:hypothetical protein [Actinoplanes sp. OR16]